MIIFVCSLLTKERIEMLDYSDFLKDLEEINKKAEDLKNRNIELNARFIKLFEK